MFTLPEPSRLCEAREKEWDGLHNCTQANVNRHLIGDDLIKLYRQQDTCFTTLDVKFHNEPAEDADGLTRELFSQGWKPSSLNSLRVPHSTCLALIRTVLKGCSRFWAALQAIDLYSLATFQLV